MHPVNHIASLMKQHNIFLKAGCVDNRINKQLKASGHFEFGDLRKIVEFNNPLESQRVLKLWAEGEEVKGWANYWNYLYKNILKQSVEDEKIKKAVLFIRFEDLCGDSESTIDKIFKHCQLENSNFSEIKAKYSSRLSLPEYYQHDFNTNEINDILHATHEVSLNFNYDINNYN
jgi:hypothetical protein